jgi:hypothetical protein
MSFTCLTLLLDRDGNVGLHAAELLQEVDVEIGAAELAVGDALQADVFLELDDLGNGVVFDGAQGLFGDLAFLLLRAGVEQALRAQEAADMVGAERGVLACRHGVSTGRARRGAAMLQAMIVRSGCE